MSAHRRARLGEQLRRELSAKIQYVVRDPEVGPLAVTGVDVSADLWFARVYVKPLGSEDEQARTMTALGRAAPFLRSVLGRELHIRRMPELRFMRDTSIEAGQRIEAILREVLPSADTEERPSPDAPRPPVEAGPAEAPEAPAETIPLRDPEPPGASEGPAGGGDR